ISADGTITFTNNIFSNNTANQDGAGAYVFLNYYGNAIFTNNTFSGNTTDWFGGGVYVSTGVGSITFTNNTFSGNAARRNGGGAFVYSNSISQTIRSTITLTNNIFSGNTTISDGGGAYVYSNGGGVYVYLASGTFNLTNNTFSGNRAQSYGGGAYVIISEDETTANVYNNIFWQNIADPGERSGNDLHVLSDANNNNIASTVNLYNNNFSGTAKDIFITLVQPGRYNHGGNIQQNPRFVNASAGDFRLQVGSACINAGNNNAP
ncbi:MAG: right-handed parallel beta-helix repeat-containing protein, partial [Gloeomargarita sp. SKYB31]|nr:right-handed parallel beta-helix repeat-containing protein [Gloeomargarita sp. SKYB31]